MISRKCERGGCVLFLILAFSIHTIPGFGQDKDVKQYENASFINIANANQIDSYENSPGSVVVYFYASMIRGDEKWKKVMIPEKKWSEVLKSKMEDYRQWKFHQFKLVKKQKAAENRYWIEVFMEIEFKGEKDSGNDDVTVEKIKGKWRITSVPT